MGKFKESDVVGKCLSMVDGDVFPPLVLGVTGKSYYNREVIVFKHPGGLFGSRVGGKDKFYHYTLVNGIVNQSALREPPTPYWAIVDAMSQMKVGFTKQDVINLAVKMVGEDQRKGCEFAWEILRNHHRHSCKKNTGTGWMIDLLPNGKMAIRARDNLETLQYFENESARRRQYIKQAV